MYAHPSIPIKGVRNNYYQFTNVCGMSLSVRQATPKYGEVKKKNLEFYGHFFLETFRYMYTYLNSGLCFSCVACSCIETE